MSRDEFETLSALAAADIGSGFSGGLLLSLYDLGLIDFSIDGWRLTASGSMTVAICSPGKSVAHPGLTARSRFAGPERRRAAQHL